MCHDLMALLMLETRKLFKYIGLFVIGDVFLCWLCRKIGFQEKKEKKVIRARRKATMDPSTGRRYCLRPRR